MKAIVQTGFGAPEDVLVLREILTPTITDEQVLVKIHAASVNALDWHLTRGMPYLTRMAAGKDSVRGVDLAGRVEAVGAKVTRFKPGDDVFGGTDGSFAEYAATTEKRLAIKPDTLTYEQAAAFNVAGLTALQGLRDRAGVQAGQRVLINGAGGGVGTFAVQIAKNLGAHVTAVTRSESVELVRLLGADEVIDYRKDDFTRRAERYDVIFDIGGRQPMLRCRRVMTRTGVLVAVGGEPGKWLAPATRMLKAMALSPFVSQRFLPFVSHNDAEGLKMLAETVKPVIDNRYTLSEVPAAIRYVGEGHARGKVVIDLA